MRESRDRNRRGLSTEPYRNLTFKVLGQEEEPAKEPFRISGDRGKMRAPKRRGCIKKEGEASWIKRC